MSNARQLAANLPREGGLSNRNILINGNFDVWQRGTSSTTSNGYGSADRWKQYTAGVGGATFAQNSDGDMHITVTGSGSGTARVGQIIEFPEKYHGQTVTFTAKVKSNSSNARLLVDTNTQWYTETDTHSGGGDWETLSITLTLESSGMTLLRFTVGLDGAQSANVSLTSSDYVTIKECQLERGDTATPFEHRSYGDQLQACKRYYWRPKDEGHQEQWMAQGLDNAGGLQVNIQHPVTMRTTPSVTIPAPSNLYWEASPWTAVGATVTSLSVNIGHMGPDGGDMGLFQNNSVTRGQNYNIGNAYFAFDAEL